MAVDHLKQGEYNMQEKKCRICRRLGVKLFLKGEKCLSPKCPIIRRSYPPGQKRKRRLRRISEYGKQLREKQKLKKWYNLRERQFKNYVKTVLETRRLRPSQGRELLRSGKLSRPDRPPVKGGPLVEDTASLLIKKLESRLDNVIFRLGLAASRAQARELVSHGHFLVNGKSVNIPSFQVKKGDKITLRPGWEKKNIFQDLQTKLKKYQPPSWLSFNIKNLTGEVVGSSTFEEASPPADISAIFEFYSR